MAGLHDIYNLQIHYLKGPASGNWSVLKIKPRAEEPEIEEKIKQEETEEMVEEEKTQEAADQQEPVKAGEPEYLTLGRVISFNPETEIDVLTIKDQELTAGENDFWLEVTGKEVRSAGYELAIIGVNLIPVRQNFALDWNIIGPFKAPDMSYLSTAYPPETEINLKKTYKGKNELAVSWQTITAPASGFVALNQSIQPSEQAIAYGLTYLYSPEDREVILLVGSDDGVKLWVNDNLVHTNPAYRGAYPDQDRVKVTLKKGWNKILIKVLQGAGGWGYYLRIPDPKGEYRWAARPSSKQD
jgi:hypothetical protein